MNPDPVTIEQLRAALNRSRHETRARGHDWDVADVLAVLDQLATDARREGGEARS